MMMATPVGVAIADNEVSVSSSYLGIHTQFATAMNV
jgi:hypothetical protein